MSGGHGNKYDVVLLDIEGTTTPISFVKDVLFPFFADALEPYLRRHYDDEQTRQDVRDLIQLSRQDKQDGLDVVVIPEDPVFVDASLEHVDVKSLACASFPHQLSAVLANVRQQMGQDRKSTALKQLQGHVWATGYASHVLQGYIYPDVVAALTRWSALPSPPRVCIYSSGSVEAQKLIFGHTNVGSLSEYITGYFDTQVGMKQDVGSYVKIMKELGVDDTKRLLFLTDVEGEASACIQAGGEAMIVVRDGNKPVNAACGIRLIRSFDEVQMTE